MKGCTKLEGQAMSVTFYSFSKSLHSQVGATFGLLLNIHKANIEHVIASETKQSLDAETALNRLPRQSLRSFLAMTAWFEE